MNNEIRKTEGKMHKPEGKERIIMKRYAGVFLLFALLLPNLSSPNNLSVEQVVKKLEQNFENIKSYQAKFEQEVRSDQFGRSLTRGAGELFYSKPGKMLWHYTSPEEHWYITNGEIFWDYLPSVKQVMEMNLDQALPSNLPRGFLFGMSKISEQFFVTFAPGSEGIKNGMYHLVLTPKKEEEKILLGTLELFVDAKNFLVKSAKLKDSLGNENYLKFEEIKINSKIDEKMFNFQIPPGVEKLTPAGKK